MAVVKVNAVHSSGIGLAVNALENNVVWMLKNLK